MGSVFPKIRFTPEGIYFSHACLEMVRGDMVKIVFVSKNQRLAIRAGKGEFRLRNMFLRMPFLCEVFYETLGWDKRFSYICVPELKEEGLVGDLDGAVKYREINASCEDKDDETGDETGSAEREETEAENGDERRENL